MTKTEKLRIASGAVGWLSTAIAQWQRELVVAAGGSPDSVPTPEFRFLRLPEVMRLTGLAKATIYFRIDQGQFPKPVPLMLSKPIAQEAAA